MHRVPLLRLLHRYLERWPDDEARIARVVEFVRTREDCLERSCREGHVTGSAWILSPDHRCVLLTHHRKLGRWLQLGGHADGETDLFLVALREAREESGMLGFRPLPEERDPVPLDVDVHVIPARAGEAAHAHFDVRFLLEAAPGQALVASEESRALRWVERAHLCEFVDEESQLRMEMRTQAVLAGLAPSPQPSG
ncbi:MAG TPA: NUDIX hydrolase [Myxococcota bacterium]|nr:NUDIX hydrolase [Myxococcota bacterium]